MECKHLIGNYWVIKNTQEDNTNIICISLVWTGRVFWHETYNLVTDYILTSIALCLFYVCLFSSLSPPFKWDPRVGRSHSLLLTYLLQQRNKNIHRVGTWTPLLQNTLSIDISPSGWGCAEPMWFLISAAKCITEPSKTGGGRRPQVLKKTSPALESIEQGKSRPSRFPYHPHLAHTPYQRGQRHGNPIQL